MRNIRLALLTLLLVVLAVALPATADQHPNQLKGFNPENVYFTHDIDTINAFNGNLTLTIPIGPEFPVAEGFSYRLTLYGNSNLWDAQEVQPRNLPFLGSRRTIQTNFEGFCDGENSTNDGVTIAHPHRRANAGFGWTLTLGRLYPEGEPSRGGAGGWMYESPDGSEHIFYDRLRASDVPGWSGGSAIQFTQDGTYLRMTNKPALNERVIEFPDGSFHTFKPSPTGRGPWLPVRMERHGSNGYVHISYPLNSDGTFNWVITDSHLRQHTLHFARKLWDGGWKAMVTSVDLAAFPASNGAARQATYQLIYKQKVIGRTEWHEKCPGFENGATVQLLEAVVLPDDSASRYSFKYNESIDFISTAGMPLYAVLPTGGVIAWDPQQWAKPQYSASAAQPYFTNSWGVGKRHLKGTVEGAPLATWEYKVWFDGNFMPDTEHTPHEMKSVAIDPLGNATASYFSVATSEDNGWQLSEYGKPFTRNKDDGAGKYLSLEQYAPAVGSAEPATGAPLRATYLKYESDDIVSNWRVAANRVVNFDDILPGNDPLNGAQWTETVNTEFDGFGHYRTATVNSSSGFGGTTRVTRTDYDFGRGLTDPTLAPKWTLGTFASVETTAGGTATTDFCFDANGLLEATRARRASWSTDLLTVFAHDSAGNVTQEAYFGGDDPQFPAPQAKCGSSAATPRYVLNHLHSAGVRSSSRYAGAAFDALDLDIDPSTGLPKTSRDSAGVPTTYEYNPVGQLRAVKPRGRAWTDYQYNVDPALTPHGSVTVRQFPANATAAGTPLTEERYYYDLFGRLIQQRRRMPDTPSAEQWSATGIEYDSLGRKARTTVPVTMFSGDYADLGSPSFTEMAYDALGRVKLTTLPDANSSTTKYKGTRRILRSSKVATPTNPSLTVWNAEEYDGLGRLATVIENTDGDNDGDEANGSLATSYHYDEGDRLTLVESGAQTRTFSYDSAGLLTDEDHPELAKTYYTYDARGHVLSKTVTHGAQSDLNTAAVALGFAYDESERLQTVTDRKAGALLKDLVYDLNGPGRLASQTRFNYFPDSQYHVTDTFSYDGVTGRPSSKVTDIVRVALANGATSTQHFTQNYDYTDLSAPAHLKYPTCSTCGAVANDPRDLLLGYQQGFLTGIQHVTPTVNGQPTGITYASTGAVHTVQHAKAGGAAGVKDTFEPDPDGMARVHSIQFDNALESVCEVPTIDPGTHTTAPNQLVHLTVTAGGSEPRTYQWYLGTYPDETHLVSTGEFYETTLATTTDFWVRVTNNCGTATAPVHVTVVCDVPSVVVDSRPPTTENTSAHLSVTVDGTPAFHYQWYRGTYPSTATPVGTDSPAYDTDALTLTGPADYWVEVTNSCGTGHASIHVTVVPCGTPFDIQATPAVFVEGASFQLSVPGGTAGPTYRWYQGTGAQKTLLATTTEPHYDVTAGIAEQTRYSVEKVTSSCTVSSNELVLEPCLKKGTARKTKDGDNYKLSVILEQSGVTFAWYEGTNHSDLSLPHGTEPILSAPGDGPKHYWVRMTRTCNTIPVSLDLDFDLSIQECLPEIFVQPVSASTELANGNALHASVVAGGAGPFAYQWFEINGSGEHALNGETSDTFTWQSSGSTPSSRKVFVEVRQGQHSEGKTAVPSKVVTLAFSATPQSIADVSGDVTLTSPLLHAPLHVTMAPTGSGHQYTYEWYTEDGTPEGAKLGQTNATISVSAFPAAAYWVEVKGTHTVGGITYEEITVSPKMFVQLSSACGLTPLRVDQSLHEICLGDGTNESPAVTFRAFNEADEVTYQWYEGQSGDTRTKMETEPETPNELVVGGNVVRKVWVRASRQCWMPQGVHQDSPTLYFTRGNCAPLFINQTLPSVEVEWGSDAQLVFQPIVGLATPAYHWYKEGATPEAPGITVPGSASTLTLTNVIKSWRYWVYVSNSACANSGSNTFPALVRVASAPGMPSPNWQTTIWWNSDSPTGAVLDATTTNADRYEWFRGEVLDESHPVSDSASPTFTTPILTADTQYWVRVHGSGGKFLDSPTITVKVCNPPKLTALQQQLLNSNLDLYVLPNQPVTLFVPITEPANGSRFAYQWFRGAKPSEAHPVGQGEITLDVHPAATTQYWFRASTTCGGNGNDPAPYESPNFTVHVCNTPVIGTQPTAIPPTIFTGNASTLSVAATVTSEGPLTYQWYAGAPGVTTAPVAAGTSASISVSPTTDTTYWVRITTGVCSVDSAAVTVTMCAYPQSVTLPANVNIPYGGITTLQFPTMYPLNQAKFTIWYRGAAGDRSTPVAYSASSSSFDFTTPALTATTQYWMEFTHLGCTTSSTATTVTVCKPTITETGQPVGGTISNGSSFTLSVGTTSIAGQTFQWYTGTPGNTSNPVAGATTASISVSPTATTSYWVRVKGTCTPEVTVDSSAATVLVCNPPSISSVSPTQYIQSGQQTGIMVNATGSNLTYQWYRGTSGTTTNAISGATSPMVYVSPTTTTSYWCKVTSESLCSVNSATITVDVCTIPVISQQPIATPDRIFPGNSSTLSVAATANGTITYQWYTGAAGNTASPIAGATAATLTVSPTADTSYWVRVTTRVCTTDSAAITVSICTYASTVTLPATRDITSGESVTLAFPTLSPGNQSKVIRWYRGAAGDHTNLVATGTATSLNYTTPQLTANTQYWVEFDHLGCTTASTATLVRVCKPTITGQPQNALILSGNSQTLSVTASGSPLTYQWYIGSSGVTTQPVSGATSSSLTVTPSSTTTYWVRATGCSTSADSAAATVTVCVAPSITNLTKTSNYAIGSSGSLTVTATGTSLTYQWYRGQSGDTSQPISGATAATYPFTLQTSQYYWVRVTSTCTSTSVNSTALLYSVAPNITVHPADVTISRGTTATLSVTATGTLLTYQWYHGASTPISGATSATYTTPTLSTGVNEYWCEVKSGTVGVNSVHAFVSLCDGPTILSFNQTYHSGNTYRLTVMVHSSQYSLVRYYWYSGVPGNLSQSTALGEGTYQEYFTVTTPTTYWVRVWFTDNTCYTDTVGKTLP